MTFEGVGPGTVFVIDDDLSVRRALRRLLLTADYRVVTCESANEFLLSPQPLPRPSCVVLDVRMPAVSGLDLQEALRAAARAIPIILISGHADVATAARAKAAGAVAFLSKPFDDVSLLAAVRKALQQDREASTNGGPQK